MDKSDQHTEKVRDEKNPAKKKGAKHVIPVRL